MLEGERDDDGNPANARSLIPSRHIDQTKDFPNTLYLFGPQTIINNILVYLRVYLDISHAKSPWEPCAARRLSRFLFTQVSIATGNYAELLFT